MKKHLITAAVIFVVVAALGLASNFIRWDETHLEQTIWALPLGIGLILELPFLAIIGMFVRDTTSYVNYPLLWTITPFIAGACYGSLYYGVVYAVKNLKKSNGKTA